MGNLFSKKLKKYETQENLSLIDNDYTSIEELESKVENNTDNIEHVTERLNDFNTNISTNFNLIQNDIKCIYKELLQLKNESKSFVLDSDCFNSFQNNNNGIIPDTLFSSIQSDSASESHQSLLK